MDPSRLAELATHGLSTARIVSRVVELIRSTYSKPGSRKLQHLDIGAGNGELIYALRSSLNIESAACDYTKDLMQLEGQVVDVCDLNEEALPYADGQFDLVTLTEVIEHVENQAHVIREAHRVLRNNGRLVVTTPNILNIKSRLRNLFFGFPVLFSPLRFDENCKYSLGGHINPISYFYLIYFLKAAGFSIEAEAIDKVQRSGVLPLILLYFPIKILGGLMRIRETVKLRNVNDLNRDAVLRMNSIPILTGRTIIFLARK